MEFAFEDWMVAASALIFGVGVGWLIWGGPRRSGEAQPAPLSERPPPPAAEHVPAESPGEIAFEGAAPVGGQTSTSVPLADSEKLGAIEREIKDARELLDEGDEEMRLFGEEILGLDAAIKRAGARLRRLVRDIRRRAVRGDDNPMAEE